MNICISKSLVLSNWVWLVFLMTLTFSCKVNKIMTVHKPSSSWYLAQVWLFTMATLKSLFITFTSIFMLFIRLVFLGPFLHRVSHLNGRFSLPWTRNLSVFFFYGYRFLSYKILPSFKESLSLFEVWWLHIMFRSVTHLELHLLCGVR